MRVFQTKDFARFARKAKLDDPAFLAAAGAVGAGRADVDLGGGVFKQRVARIGGGKSGGFRTVIAFRAGGHAFFVHGFAKNEKANVTVGELKALKALAETLLGLDSGSLETAVEAGALIELKEADDERKD